MNSNYGTIRIKLTEITQSQNISKNAVMKKADMQRTQLNHYYRNEITLIWEEGMELDLPAADKIMETEFQVIFEESLVDYSEFR